MYNNPRKTLQSHKSISPGSKFLKNSLINNEKFSAVNEVDYFHDKIQ